jgi:hypothetical protein
MKIMMQTAEKIAEGFAARQAAKGPRVHAKEIVALIRSLPDDEAERLLSLYGMMCDGDCGYGSWSVALEIWRQED